MEIVIHPIHLHHPRGFSHRFSLAASCSASIARSVAIECSAPPGATANEESLAQGSVENQHEISMKISLKSSINGGLNGKFNGHPLAIWDLTCEQWEFHQESHVEFLWDWISKNSGKIIALGGEEWDIVETASSRCVKKRPRPPFHPTEIFTKLVRLSAAGSGSHSICKKSHGMSWLSANQYHCMILWSPIFFGAPPGLSDSLSKWLRRAVISSVRLAQGTQGTQRIRIQWVSWRKWGQPAK